MAYCRFWKFKDEYEKEQSCAFIAVLFKVGVVHKFFLQVCNEINTKKECLQTLIAKIYLTE